MPLTQREAELLRLLDVYLMHLQGSLKIDPAALAPFDPVDASTQRWLQLAVQCCIDLGDSLLARANQPEPPRQRDIFGALARAGIINPSLVSVLERLTDYRNRLAHAYSSLKPEETWREVRSGLPILAEFAGQVGKQ
ncbi:MAG: DUF86 domain-containing protein [Chloroflexi bacterium]|nr:DUF86 domain-containing protein [Chloroflexota bacterium]